MRSKWQLTLHIKLSPTEAALLRLDRSLKATDLETVIVDMLDGQFRRPLKRCFRNYQSAKSFSFGQADKNNPDALQPAAGFFREPKQPSGTS
jgi:hypothetical protein